MAPSVKARVAAVLIVLTPVAAAAAVETVTERDAIRIFLEQSPQARLGPLIERSVAADIRRGAPLPNPAVAYQVEDAAGVRDQYLTFQQALPITGRQRLVREAADAGAQAAGLAASQELRASASAVRNSFYEVLYGEGVLDRLRQGVERLQRVVDIVAKRESEGEGSGYDLLRAEQELAELGIETAGAEVALSAARSRFGSFFDPAQQMASARLEGTLDLAEAPPETGDEVDRALSQRDDLKALRAEARRLGLERQAARRQRLPEPTLSAGWKRVEGLDLEDTGFIAALTVPLPIFDRGQIESAQAAADLERSGLEAEILARRIRAEVEAALAREHTAREAARLHGAHVEQRAADLRKIAELAYDEGEAGILELLDAYRTALSTELRALGVRYEAKRAEIERERVLGIEVTP
jgi:cobalt-zinc-cadmium efflux system outer membrane protein